MSFFLKLVILSSLFVGLCAQTAMAEGVTKVYSNVYIFGDSQSDIGNIPESNRHITKASLEDSNLILNLKEVDGSTKRSSEIAVGNYIQNTYVPYSTPESTKLTSYSIPIISANKNQKNDQNILMPTKANIKAWESNRFAQPTINGNERKTISLNWVNLLLQRLQNDSAIETETNVDGEEVVNIRPWAYNYMLFKYPQDNLGRDPQTGNISKTSINYAWISAQSDESVWNFCFINFQKPVNGAVTDDKIYAQQQQFRNYQFETEYDNSKTGMHFNPLNPDKIDINNLSPIDSLANVYVPSTMRQIEMFNNDYRNHRIAPTDSSLYILYTGANDIANIDSNLSGSSVQKIKKVKNVIENDIPNLIASYEETGTALTGKSVLVKLINTLKSQLNNPKGKVNLDNIVVIGQYNVGAIPASLNALKTNDEREVLREVVNGYFVKYNKNLGDLVSKLSKYCNDNNIGIGTIKFVDLLPRQTQRSIFSNATIYTSLSGLVDGHNTRQGYRTALDSGLMIDQKTPTAIDNSKDMIKDISKGASIDDYMNQSFNRTLFWNGAHLDFLGNAINANLIFHELIGK
jgi:hypothetical protein